MKPLGRKRKQFAVIPLGLYTFFMAVSSAARFWNFSFHSTFGYFGHIRIWQMRRGPAWWLLPWIMPALLGLCLGRRRGLSGMIVE
jgi:hypothetical protein